MTSSNPSKYRGNELKYLTQVLNSEAWSATSGSWNQNLEVAFAKKFESKYAVAFNSGTATLHAALEAVGVQAGDEVISPAVTVIMDTTATLHANAIPVYADVQKDSFNIDPADVRRKITPKTKAIIAVALYGLPPDMDELLAISKEFDIPLIEDNAQCFLSRYKGKLTGTFGSVASYSFEASKHMSCGEGGIIISNSEKIARMCRKIGGHGFKNLAAEEGRIRLQLDDFQRPEYKRHDEVGWNYRLSEFSAAVSLAQLEDLDVSVERRKKCGQFFLDAIEGCDFLVPQKVYSDRDNSYFTFGLVYLGQEKLGVSWQAFRKEYMNQGGDGVYAAWSVPYQEPVMAERTFVRRAPQIYENVKYENGLCPVAEYLQARLMQFKTNYRDLKIAEQKADALRKAIKKVKQGL